MYVADLLDAAVVLAARQRRRRGGDGVARGLGVDAAAAAGRDVLLVAVFVDVLLDAVARGAARADVRDAVAVDDGADEEAPREHAPRHVEHERGVGAEVLGALHRDRDARQQPTDEDLREEAAAELDQDHQERLERDEQREADDPKEPPQERAHGVAPLRGVVVVELAGVRQREAEEQQRGDDDEHDERKDGEQRRPAERADLVPRDPQRGEQKVEPDRAEDREERDDVGVAPAVREAARMPVADQQRRERRDREDDGERPHDALAMHGGPHRAHRVARVRRGRDERDEPERTPDVVPARVVER